MIRVPQLRIVDEEGSQLGVMPTAEALRLAQDRGYDLVEVAPMAAPPVARLLDYGQFKYEQARREKEARRHQRSVDFKEIRLKPKIGKGDFDTKVRRAIQFLEDGDRVKVTCQFRGREVSHAHLGRDLLMRFAEKVQEHGAVERQPLLEGRSMSIVIASTHKPRQQRREETEQVADKVDGHAPAEGSPAPESPAEPAPTDRQPAPTTPPAPRSAPARPAATKPAAAKPAATKPAATKPAAAAAPVGEGRAPAVSAPARPAGG
jgi:translation initiation factor IF-3